VCVKWRKRRESECEKRLEWAVPFEYRIPDLGLHGCDSDLRHLMRFAAMLCVRNIVVPLFIYIQIEFPVKTLVLWDVAPC